MQKKQVFNPYLPLHEYIPDGEPHVFDNRLYIFGSHDKEGGYTFCMNDYVVYSAPLDDLSDWRYEGVSYRASSDPLYAEKKYLYAPDVVKGNDGKYYLYYCMGGDYGYGGYTGPICVAVSDSPAGEYSYLGVVRNPDGTPMMKYICFDPAVINDNGTIRVYYGTQYGYEEEPDFALNEEYIRAEIEMFGRSKEEILSYEDSIMGAVMLTLEDDMLTVKEEPAHIIPYKVKGTSFEEHPFFEGASIRKIGDKYYFIYSSWQNHELCYATSDFPDRDFVFGGTIVSNGDVGIDGRTSKKRLNMTGTTHGSIVCVKDQWYVFYHRLTHKSDYSRQSCAEKIYFEKDGSIRQVEITSCGLNEGPLKGQGKYPAVICCNLTNWNMPHGSNTIYDYEFPNVNNKGDERFITEIENNTLIGYKYFDLTNTGAVKIRLRADNAANKVICNCPVRIDERCLGHTADRGEKPDESQAQNPRIEVKTSIDGKPIGVIEICREIFEDNTGKWYEFGTAIEAQNGVKALYFNYYGTEKIQILEFELMRRGR